MSIYFSYFSHIKEENGVLKITTTNLFIKESNGYDLN